MKIQYKQILYFFLLLLTLTYSSCIQNKKVTFLRNKSLKKPYPKDSVVKSYTPAPFKYTLDSKDVISINIASLTDEKFDFFKDYTDKLGPYLIMNNSKNTNAGNIQGGGNGSNVTNRPLGGFIINDSGYVELPILGFVKLIGLSISEAEQVIKKQVEGFVESPLVRVNILSFQFTILGEISQPGIYTSFNPDLSLLEAITLANNAKEYADLANIKLVRKENGVDKIIYLNILQEKFLTSGYYYVRPHDIIILPPLRAREISNYGFRNFSIVMSIISSTLVLILTIATLKNRVI